MDVNKIIESLNASWAQDLSKAKTENAVLSEENDRLKAKVAELERGQSKGTEDDAD